jgi:hypothetical protein
MKFKLVLVLALVVIISGAVRSQAQSTGHLRLPALVAHPADPESQSLNTRAASAAPTTASTITCSFTFTNPGKLNSYMQYCVTANGNITSLMSPNGFEYINQGGLVGEGYGICDLSTNVAYYDWAYTDSGNWNAPVLVSSTASAVKIVRTTTDGLFTLTQTITKQGGTIPAAKITMSVKNNVGVAKEIYLVRYADVDPANAPQTDTNFGETFDSTQYAAFGYGPLGSSSPLGLMLEEIGQPNVSYAFEGLDQNSEFAPNPCSPTANYAGLETNTDGSAEMLWLLVLNGLKTGTVNAKYSQF